jgi:hypothetical protein
MDRPAGPDDEAATLGQSLLAEETKHPRSGTVREFGARGQDVAGSSVDDFVERVTPPQRLEL